MSKWVEGEGGEPIDVSTMEDVWGRHSMDKPELQKMEVEAETVAVKVGRLEIRPRAGDLPWSVDVLLDGEPVKRVRRINLGIEYGKAPTVTITHYV